MKEYIKCRAILFTLVIIAVLYLTGCQTMRGAVNKTKEIFGAQKRDIMVAEVQDAYSSLEGVKAQFQSAMEKFRSVLNSNEIKLDAKYKLLKSENKKTEKKAGDIQKNIDAVTKAAEALFTEWETQLNQYTSENLRSMSEQRMQKATNQTMQFVDAMTRANEKAGPALAAFNDLVLFSSHELNAQAIEALNNELISVEEKVDSLIKEIDLSIGEADTLIKLMVGSEIKVNNEDSKS